jgi:hypothetical protein
MRAAALPHQALETVLVKTAISEHVAGHNHMARPCVQVLSRILRRHATADVHAARVR